MAGTTLPQESAPDLEQGGRGTRPAGIAVADIAQAGVMVALLAVSAQVTVALGPIPFTLQTLVVVLAALVFTPRQAVLAVVAYAVLGALGLPVFSAMRGGLAVIAGPTGGYIYGFILSVLVGSLVRRAVCRPAQRAAHPRRGLVADVVAGVLAVALCYTVGTVHFMVVGSMGSSAVDLAYVLGVCVVPFIVPDALKMVAAILVATALRKALPEVAKR